MIETNTNAWDDIWERLKRRIRNRADDSIHNQVAKNVYDFRTIWIHIFHEIKFVLRFYSKLI